VHNLFGLNAAKKEEEKEQLSKQATSALLGHSPAFPQCTTAASFPPAAHDAL